MADGLRSCQGFRPFWAAATVSSFGTYVTTLAVQVLVVLTLHGGATEVGLVNAARWLGLSPFAFGLALAAGGAGGLLGALVATNLGARFGAGRIVVASIAGNGLAWAVIATGVHGWAGWAVFSVGQFLLGLTMGAANPNEMGYLQSITPDHLQGRANATRRSINRAMIVVGAPLGGVLADTVGYRAMLYAAAAGFGLVALALAATPYRRARFEDAATG